LFENEIEQSEKVYQEYYDTLYKKHSIVTQNDKLFSSEAIFRRIIECINYLKTTIKKETSYSMEKIHLDWINDVLANVLYVLEPSDFIKRAALAATFGITNYDKWAFAFWPRRTGKSFINGILFMSVLMCIPSGSMAVQSVGMKSALQTVLPFRGHIKHLFKYFGIEDIEPIRTFSVNGIKFINFYGAQLLMDGLHSVNDLPDYCFSTVQIISGDDDAGRGITKHIYLMDESEFMKEGAKRNTMMNSKRNGSIVVGISSEDPKQQNPRLEKMTQISHLATVSIYRNICDKCRRLQKIDCPHVSEPGWIGNTKDLNEVMDAFIENQEINLLERIGGSLLSSGNIFALPKEMDIEDYLFEEPVQPIKYIFCSIDPALSRKTGASEYASMIFGLSEVFEEVDNQKNNCFYIFDTLYQNMGSMNERCNKVIDQIFEFRTTYPEYESFPIIFIPENNQGDLPITLKTQLLNYCPYLCNWYIYSEKKPLHDATEGGFCTTDSTKFLGANAFRILIQNGRLKFHKRMKTPQILKLMEQFQNAQQKINPYGKRGIPEIYAKHKTNNDGLMCGFIGVMGGHGFMLDKNVQFYTLNNYYKKCTGCDRYKHGHSELVGKRRYGEITTIR
jgi:hypothetical protein